MESQLRKIGERFAWKDASFGWMKKGNIGIRINEESTSTSRTVREEEGRSKDERSLAYAREQERLRWAIKAERSEHSMII